MNRTITALLTNVYAKVLLALGNVEKQSWAAASDQSTEKINK